MSAAYWPRMTFGKHYGKRVCDVPRNYLRWCLANVVDLDPALRRAMNDTLQDRHNGEPTTETSPAPLDPLVRRWFNECAMTYHPDRGGDVESMKVVNDCHDRLRRILTEVG
jgi:uncharacterized protein (DUF3820 family)